MFLSPPPPLDTSTLQDVGAEIRRFSLHPFPSFSSFPSLVSFLLFLIPSLGRGVQLSRTIARYYCPCPFLVLKFGSRRIERKGRKERGERKEIRWKKDPVGILFAASSIRLIVDTVPSKRRVHAHVRARARVYAVNVISNKQISGWLDVNHAREAIRLNFGLRDEFARILEVAYRASIERAARERAANEQIIRKAPRAGQMSVPPRGIRVACG